MENINFDINRYLAENSKSIKDYVILIRTNLTLFISIFLLIVIAAIIFSILSGNVYKSTVSIRINTQKQNILDSRTLPELADASDRFIANEIEIFNNYDSRERYAKALIDSFGNSKSKKLFNLLLERPGVDTKRHKSLKDIAELLSGVVTVEQLSGLDIIDISAESPSPYEAALIANTCAAKYKELNLESNRGQLSTLRKFLEKQTEEKSDELINAEEKLKNFQQQGGIVALDAQSNVLINQLASLDAQRDAAKVDLLTSNEILSQYKKEISEQDPQLADYLESQASQTYIDALQKQITEFQMNKDLAFSKINPNVDVSAKIQEYDKKIAELKQKLNTVINDIKVGAYSSSPEQIRSLTQKLIAEKVNNNSLLIKYNELQNIINKYEQNLNTLPKTSIELAQYQRKRESTQQLYQLVEQKYQEAMINELSQPGNAMIIGKGRVPDSPSKPNRKLITIIGIIAGLGFAFGFVLIKDHLDDTVKTPNDIEQNNINLLAWVPHLKKVNEDYFRKHEIGTSGQTDSILKESFKSLRARIQFSKGNQVRPFKTILITSAAAEEGKTIISVNLAASFARSNKKTLLIDCDLIKPKIHSIMGIKRNPGLTDYLQKKASFEEILNKCGVNDLEYISAGTALKNTDEILYSEGMKSFLCKVSDMFEIIILDSAPIVPIIDSQVLARLTDTSILVVSAGKTETELMINAVDLIRKDNLPFLGIVFNNFRYNNGYNYYYKYYYNYSSKGNGSLTKRKKVTA